MWDSPHFQLFYFNERSEFSIYGLRLPAYRNSRQWGIYYIYDMSEPILWHHNAVVLQNGGALAPKAITKQMFFFRMVTLIMFVIYMFFFIKVEITLLITVNLTDCFTSTLNVLPNISQSINQSIKNKMQKWKYAIVIIYIYI